MSKLVHGVWGVLPTPFQQMTLDVDLPSLKAILDLYQRAGVAGVVALGVFGEAAQLTEHERALVVRAASESAGPHRLVVGLTTLTTAETCAEARQAVAAAPEQLAAVMVQINSTDAGAVAAHLRAVHDACGLSIVLQDYPVVSGIRVDHSLIAEVAQSVDFLAAIKCESPPTSPAIAALSASTDVPLFGGLGGIGLLDELQAGAAGAMTGFAYPEALVEVVQAWRDGGYDVARRAILPWLPLINFEAQAVVGLSIRKENLRRRGFLASAAVRPPAMPLPASMLDLVSAHQRGVSGMGI